MSLTALQHLSREDATAALVAASLATSPHAEEQSVPPTLQSAVTDLLREIRSRLGLADGDRSASARQRLDDALSEEMERVAFSEEAIDQAVDALGSRGELATSAYKLEVGSHLKRYHESEPFIRRVVAHSDVVQHMNPEVRAHGDEQFRISLFLKKVEGRKASHWALVQANRYKDRLIVLATWRVSPRFVDLSRALSPIDVLRAFIDHYGLTMFGNEDSFVGKIAENVDLGDYSRRREHGKSFARPEGAEISEDALAGVNASYIETGYRRFNDRAILAIAYAIDADRYLADRRRIVS